MGVKKTVLVEGTGPRPKNGQVVIMEYTGYLKDMAQPDNKGAIFDSSKGGENLVVQIGVGRVIKGALGLFCVRPDMYGLASRGLTESPLYRSGWDVAVLDMMLGEKATLEMTSDYAYGNYGFPGHIPPKADLIFDVCLKGIQ